MINLIPPDAQKQVKSEYWIRVVSVWMILVGSAFLLVTILLTPVYVLINGQLESFLYEYNQANSESQSFVESETEITEINKIATLLANADEEVTFSNIIIKIEQLASSDIQIENFTLSRKGGEISPIVVSGQAGSRFALTEFKDAIEASRIFKSVSLPLSNLAKDTDITFSITIIPSEKMTE